MSCVFHYIYGQFQGKLGFGQFWKKLGLGQTPTPLLGPNSQLLPKICSGGSPNDYNDYNDYFYIDFNDNLWEYPGLQNDSLDLFFIRDLKKIS